MQLEHIQNAEIRKLTYSLFSLYNEVNALLCFSFWLRVLD